MRGRARVDHQRSGDGAAGHPTREEWFPGGDGRCLHTVILPPARPGRLYAGISCAGLFRSADAGESWRNINAGLPTDFGFPIAVGAGAGAGEEPAIFVVPEDGNTLRTAERLADWRSRRSTAGRC